MDLTSLLVLSFGPHISPHTARLAPDAPTNTARCVTHRAEKVNVLGDGELVEEDVVLRTHAKRGVHLVHLCPDVEPVDNRRAGRGWEQTWPNTGAPVRCLKKAKLYIQRDVPCEVKMWTLQSAGKRCTSEDVRCV